MAGPVGRRAWETIQEEVGRDWVAPGPPPLGGWPLAPLAVGYLVSWVLRLAGLVAPCRRRLAPSQQAVAFLAVCMPRALHCSASAPHDLFLCRPPSGRGRAGRGQSLRGGPLRGSGWLRPSAGPSKAPGPRALVTKAPGPQGPGQTRRHQGPQPWSSARPPPGATTGGGVARRRHLRWPPARRQRQTP